MVSIHTDSITLNPEQKKFVFRKTDDYQEVIHYYPKINHRGFYEDLIRSPNNPHGVILRNWRIIDNEDISNQSKNSY